MNWKFVGAWMVTGALLACTVGCGGGDGPAPKPASGGGGSGGDSAPPAAAAEVIRPDGEADADNPWGTLKGKFVVDGDVPSAGAVAITKDVEFCGTHNLVDEGVVVDANGGLANVVVFLYQKRGGDELKVHPDYEAAAQEAVQMDNDKCRFEPRIALVRTGQKLIIGNKDTVPHNSKIETKSNPVVNPVIPATEMTEVTFENEERMPVGVTCSIHPWMQGWIVVQSHPYTAVTNAAGEFEIKNVPTGEWTFAIWHETAGFVDTVSVGGTSTEWKKGRVEVEIGGGLTTDFGEVKVPASKFE